MFKNLLNNRHFTIWYVCYTHPYFILNCPSKDCLKEIASGDKATQCIVFTIAFFYYSFCAEDSMQYLQTHAQDIISFHFRPEPRPGDGSGGRRPILLLRRYPGTYWGLQLNNKILIKRVTKYNALSTSI